MDETILTNGKIVTQISSHIRRADFHLSIHSHTRKRYSILRASFFSLTIDVCVCVCVWNPYAKTESFFAAPNTRSKKEQ